MDMNIQLAMISDANYLDFAAITLTSILYHHRGGGLTVHMIHPLGMQEEKLEKIRKMQNISLSVKWREPSVYAGSSRLRKNPACAGF